MHNFIAVFAEFFKKCLKGIIALFGVFINSRDKSYKTNVSAKNKVDLDRELIKAVEWRDINKINNLLDKGADINVINEYGQTSLIEASMNDEKEIVTLLLKRGANPNLRGKGEYTALITACVVGHYDIVKLLVLGGADINITDERGLTGLNFAKDRGYNDIVKFLLLAGAKSKNDASPCCWTCAEAGEANDKQLHCTLDFRNVKTVRKDYLCSAYRKRTNYNKI